MKETVLRNHPKSNNVNNLSLLVISNETFCNHLNEAFRKVQKRHSRYRLLILTCEHVSNILQFDTRQHIDYVVFALDTTDPTCIEQVESNLEKMDRAYACGKICLVNGNPHIPMSEMNITINSIRALKNKYKFPLLNGNIVDEHSCNTLAESIFNLMEVTLGLHHNASFVPWLAT